MSDDVKRYQHNIGGIFQGEEKFIEVVPATAYLALRQQLDDRQHELDSLNICESCSPSDAANEKCPLCLAKFMREKDDAAFRQTIGELEQQLEAAHRDRDAIQVRYEASQRAAFGLEKLASDNDLRAEQAEARVRELEQESIKCMERTAHTVKASWEDHCRELEAKLAAAEAEIKRLKHENTPRS